MTVLYGLGALNVFLNPAQNTISIAAATLQILTLLGLLILIVLRITAGREATTRVWLAWGNASYWLLFGLGFVIFYDLQAALNANSGLGGTGSVPRGIHSPILLVLAGVQAEN